MNKTRGVKTSGIAKFIGDTLVKYPELISTVDSETTLYRIQPCKYDNSPVNYKYDSDTRYSDPEQVVGVYYLGYSEKVAIAESFQSGQGAVLPGGETTEEFLESLGVVLV